MTTVLVAGGGGFIGGHLTKKLVAQGYDVRVVDVKPLVAWEQRCPTTQRWVADLRELSECLEATRGVDVVYDLAADMGGIGFIEGHRADCMLSVLINTNLLRAASSAGVRRYLYASSACVYPARAQSRPDVAPLREDDAYPADPEDGYGWEKLFGERMCRHFREDYGLETRVARYHNVYGPLGTWVGGREKAPAAICRKVAYAKLTGDRVIEVWGDGEQTRSFTYVDDCVDMTLALAASDVVEPLNVGSSELVTINQLITYVEEVADVTVERRYRLDAPRGVRGRNSDNTLALARLGMEPTTPLRRGLEDTYRWIEERVAARLETR